MKILVGQIQNMPALRLQFEKQPEIRPAAAALRSLLHFGSTNGTTHFFNP
jgi:hypothetical protein